MATDKKRLGPKDLCIDLSTATDRNLFRWLIACQLFGARISQDIAARAFRELDHDGVLAPRKLAEADWRHLVDLLGAGGYRRYDEATARALIANGKLALGRYDGKITRIRDGVASAKELRDRVQEFTGVGPKAAEIFVREVLSA